jgi:hypothetical protein
VMSLSTCEVRCAVGVTGGMKGGGFRGWSWGTSEKAKREVRCVNMGAA